MDWIDRFDLFLFDFDGLLVNTEELHFEAYREMCRRRGCTLPWDMHEYLEIAHLDGVGIRKGIYALFPELVRQEPRWEALYAEKKKIYEELLEKRGPSLLPGVQPVLERLAELNKKRCVVTNSAFVQTEMIKAQLPILKTIPRWFTRESYALAKPAPDGYVAALAELKAEEDRVIGFEDSVRGMQALEEAHVSTPVLICPSTHPQLHHNGDAKRLHVPSFEAISAELFG